METTERIVEAYVRYVKGWATIPNIKCDGQKEIDLFAIDPVNGDRYHIETTVSISQSYRALTAKAFTLGDHKIRKKAAGARRTLGFFLKEKFEAPGVKGNPFQVRCEPRLQEDHCNLGVETRREGGSRRSWY